MNLLEESDLDRYVTKVVEEPTDDARETAYKKNQAKEKRIIYDSVKDHLIPIISPLKTAKESYDIFVKLFETKTASRKRALKSKLCSIKMTKDSTIATLFIKISQLNDQLVGIGGKVEDDDLVQTAIGLPPIWETFVSGVCACENQPNFERFWVDCLQEEGRIMNKSDPPSEENIALVANTKKGRGRRFPSQNNNDRNPKINQERRQVDVSNVKCYDYHKLGHFARDCPDKRRKYKRKLHACATDLDDGPQKKKSRESNLDQVAKVIRKEYYLISALSSTITKSVETWLVDSSASRHMTGYRSTLTDLTEKKSFVHVELGDDATYAIQGVRSTSF